MRLINVKLKRFSFLHAWVVGLLFGLLFPVQSYAAVTWPTLAQMLETINTQIPALWELVTAFAYIAGFFMVFRSLYHFKQAGDPHSASGGQRDIKPAFATFIIGIALIFSPSAMQSGLATVFGTTSPIGYPTGAGVNNSYGELGQVLYSIIQFVGVVTFIRGLMHFHKLGSGQAQHGTFNKGLTHVIGGILCLNVLGTASVIASTLGITGF